MASFNFCRLGFKSQLSKKGCFFDERFFVSFQVKVDIENSIGDIRPKIKEEIRQMGKKLADHAAAIQVRSKAI